MSLDSFKNFFNMCVLKLLKCIPRIEIEYAKADEEERWTYDIDEKGQWRRKEKE